jgi:HD-GYP domain-containing protein (c-di-GMP phosphodiesterase class II)
MLPQTFGVSSGSYNPLQLDAYLLRLTDVKQTAKVYATENIYNLEHALLLPAGALLTHTIASTFVAHTLAKSLETSIRLEGCIDAEVLEQNLVNILQQDSILLAINEHHNLTVSLKALCESADKFTVLCQKLTVMSHTMPDIFRRTLYCTWLSLLVANEMRLSRADIETVFLAALAHDIGMLHIDATVLNQQVSRTSVEWQHIQKHVAIGFELMRAMPDMPAEAAEAVYEHHERCDGTGYPHGKVESELCLPGQIVGLADSVMAIYHNRFSAQGNSWRSAIPIIQMNLQAYFFRAFDVLMTILRRSELPPKDVVVGDMTPEFVNNLFYRNEQLKNWFETMRDCLMSIGFRHGDRHLHSLQNVMLHLSTSAQGSGIFLEQHERLKVIVDNECVVESFSDIENTHLIQQEILFHLHRLARMTQLYLDSGSCQKEPIKQTLLSGLAKAQQYLL